MIEVTVRLPQTVLKAGVKAPVDIELSGLESRTASLRTLEKLICATGLTVNPFDVVEAVATEDGKSYHYVRGVSA